MIHRQRCGSIRSAATPLPGASSLEPTSYIPRAPIRRSSPKSRQFPQKCVVAPGRRPSLASVSYLPR